MSEYPKQPPAGRGWPTQPPQYTVSGHGGYPQPGYGPNEHQQAGYGHSGYDQEGWGGYLDPHGRRTRRRRRGRGWIALLITLIVLAVLLVVGDRIAKAYTQNTIASQLQSSSGMSTKPAVTIEGFPFLTQVVAHDIRTIDISASNVQAGKLDITSINATATGVHPDWSLTNWSFNGVRIDHISGTALISFASLLNAAGARGITVTADPAGGPGAARVSAGPLSGSARITQTGPSQLTVKVESVDGIPSSLLGSLPDYQLNVPQLPAGAQIKGVAVTDQGIKVRFAAHNTMLSR